MFGDYFSVADADAVTFKFGNDVIGGAAGATTRAHDGSNTNDINTTVAGVLYAEAIRAGADSYVAKHVNFKLTGAFDMALLINVTTHPNNAYAGFDAVNDVDNRIVMDIRESGSSSIIRSLSYVGGTPGITQNTLNDRNVWLRLTRAGDNTLTTYYDLDDTHTRANWSWTQHQSVAGFSGDVYAGIWFLQFSTNDTMDGTVDQFEIITGTAAGGETPYRTSGNWTSASQTMTAGYQLSQIDIDHSGLDGSNYIDNVYILRASDDAVLNTYATNIITGSSTTLTATELGDLSGTADTNIKVKVDLVGDGTTTPVITQITGTYAATSSRKNPNLGASNLIGNEDISGLGDGNRMRGVILGGIR